MLNEVKRLMVEFPTYQVKTTGHSLGGALAILTAMELEANGITTTMINFGQPRVGDSDWADFTMNQLSHYRVTHYRDPVPNIPPQWPTDYHHTKYEMFQYERTPVDVRQCDASGEDPTCTDKWLAFQYNVDDHLTYLGMCMGGTCGTCPNSATANKIEETSTIKEKLDMATSTLFRLLQ